MASKSELYRRIVNLERMIMGLESRMDHRVNNIGDELFSVTKVKFLNDRRVPTIRGELNAIKEHLGIEVDMSDPKPSEIVVRKKTANRDSKGRFTGK